MNLSNVPNLTQEQIEAFRIELKATTHRKKLSGVFIASAGKLRSDMGGDPHSIERAQNLCSAWNTYAASEGSTIRICVEGTQQTLPATAKTPAPGRVK